MKQSPPKTRAVRFDSPAPDKAPSFAAVLALRQWTKDAACADSDDPELWFVEGSPKDREALASPRALRAYLTCVGCPVRRQCLAEALMVAPVLMNAGDKAPRSKELVTYGTWGASSEKDRAAVRHLPTEEAIKRLEDGLPDRVQRRIAAFEKKHNRGQASTAAAWKHLDEMRGTRSAERAPHEGQAPGEPNGRVRPRARSPAAL